MVLLRTPIFKTIRQKVLDAGHKQGWIDARSILVAVSGGGDSVALLALLSELFSGRLAAAHVEHGLRSERSVADMEFTQKLCDSLGVRCHVLRADISMNRLTGESDEMAGRRARYGFFSSLCREHGYQMTATGHNADDSVETALLDMFRGTGIRGLAGIPGRRGYIVRPLICCARTELRQLLRENDIEWREDETNSETRYLRNRIRLELLPWVRENISAGADRAIEAITVECARISSEIEQRAAAAVDSLSICPAGPAIAAWDLVSARTLADDALAEALREQGRRLELRTLDRARTEQLIKFLRRGIGRSRFQWSGDVEVLLYKRKIFWLHREDIKIILEGQ